jgi:signal transduction histidine kinase
MRLRRSEADSRPDRAAVLKFALSGLAVVVLLGLVGLQLLRRTGTNEAIRDAKRVTRLAGQGIVEPAVGNGLLRGDPEAIRRLDRVVRGRLLRDPVVRVKIWTRDGRILYSDEPRLIGSQYRLDREDARVFDTGRVEAEVSNLSRPENRFERRFGKLLEVYFPITAPNGDKLLFESYLRFSSVAASGRSIWLSFAPALLGALVVLWLIQLPLAFGLARRIREGQRDRERLLRRAIDASEIERRRIAQDLHDGAVQNLAGVSYSLAAAADRAPEPVDATLRAAAGETRATIRELRSLLVEIYPPDLHRVGLEGALTDLVAPSRRRGIDTELAVPPELELPPDVEALFFRVAQEALRNALAHADPSRVQIRVERDDGCARLLVEDDGRGFDPGRDGRDGHFGLRMIADSTHDVGGEVEIDSTPGRGTRVRVEVPVT